MLLSPRKPTWSTTSFSECSDIMSSSRRGVSDFIKTGCFTRWLVWGLISNKNSNNLSLLPASLRQQMFRGDSNLNSPTWKNNAAALLSEKIPCENEIYEEHWQASEGKVKPKAGLACLHPFRMLTLISSNWFIATPSAQFQHMILVKESLQTLMSKKLDVTQQPEMWTFF